ncbi:MAG: hypothetical protein JNN29_10480 [Chitinophagaceae bacterium]|nr:hypothetical protein [Chitinophagaceae bacterium]
MPTNNFEKRVQEEMEGFKLPPSDDVWLIVEEKIRERKRRRFLFWLLPILLGGAMATYFLLNRPDSNASSELTTVQPTTVKEAIKKEQESSNMTVDPGANTLPTPKEKAGKNASGLSSGPEQITASPELAIERKRSNTIKPLKDKNVTNPEPVNESVGFITSPEEIPAGKPVLERNTLPEITDQVKRSIAPANLFKVQPESLKNGWFSSGFHWMETLDAESPSIVKPSSRRSPKWIFAVKAGGYNIADPLFGGTSEKAFAGNLNGPGSGTGNSSATIISETLPKAAFSYGFMVGRQFPVGPKHYFKTGLGFAQYSHVRQVGAYRDSAASPNFSLSDQSAGFYRGGTFTNFRSRYLVLELPMSMMWKIGKSKNLPLQLETGLLYGQVIKARGLVYGGYGYFDDRDQVRKSQWQLQLGFGTSLFNASRHPLGIGLTYQAGLHSFYKKEVGDLKASHFSGVQLTFPF